MPLCKRLIILLSVVYFACADATAQVARSAFSSFGIGDHYGHGLVHNQGMGGVGLSKPQYWFLNNQNPALLVFNNLTVFGAGFIGEQRTVTNGEVSAENGNGNLNYLTLGFPVKSRKWSMAIGLMPYTSTNYQLSYTVPVENSTNTAEVTESGSGGINQLYWAHGVRLHKNISVGGRLNYLFSSVVNEFNNTLSQTSQTVPISINTYERYHFSDFSFTGALSFHKDSLFSKNYQINLGLVYDFKANVHTDYYQSIQRRNLAGIIDSLTLVNNVPGITTLPPAIGVGISFGKGYQWAIAADYHYYDYKQFKDFQGEAPATQAGTEMALGFELTPNPGSLSNYLKRVTYRTGVSYASSPYAVNGNEVRDFGINFGLSLPVSRVSSLDLALRLGKRGDLQTNTIEENYLRFYFGLTFNDQWFIKRKFD